ncbi:MAG TPA: FAD-binding oxidoreductase [Solirubrobacteraceae bacterium]|jgi:4-cresol dehydrogenase (hydroxylating)
MSAATLDRALERIAQALVPDKVVRDPAALREYSDPFAFEGWQEHAPGAAVLPTQVEEVQAVVRIAAEEGVPIWTHSTGRNNGYGGAGPLLGGSVIVSLRNMNRVLELDGELGYALVEPGVRWFDLYEAIEAAGLDLMLSIADLGWGGPVGNMLENGVTYLPYGVDWTAQCGMEVVLPTGELLRTGMGAMPGNRSWNLYKRGLGPTLDQIFTQSNYGIVTKMGVWLQPRPEAYAPIWVRVWKDDDIAPLIDTLRVLLLDGTVRMVPTILNALNTAALHTARKDWYQGEGPIPEPEIDRIARELDTGRWMMRLALHGDEPVVAHRLAKVTAAFEAIAGAEVRSSVYRRDDIPNLEVAGEKTMAGIPNMAFTHITRWAGGDSGGHIGFSPVVPLTGSEILRARGVLREQVHAAGMDYLAGLLPINARSLVHITMLMFDTADETGTRTAYDLARKLVVDCAPHGFGEYRAHVDFMDAAAAQYSFGDHAYRRFCETLKDAIDPAGILMPGKNGIWPAHLRQ